jgi:hypothetical protein
LQPGQTVQVRAPFSMPKGMGGPHHFDWIISTNDPVQPQQTITVKADYPLP